MIVSQPKDVIQKKVTGKGMRSKIWNTLRRARMILDENMRYCDSTGAADI